MTTADTTAADLGEKRRGLFHRVVVDGIIAPLKAYPFGLFPTFMLGVFFFIPFLIMIDISFWHRVESRTYERAFELTHYARFFLAALCQTSMGLGRVRSAFKCGLPGGLRTVHIFPQPISAQTTGHRARLYSLCAVAVGSHHRLFLVGLAVPLGRSA